ncbi:MAG TPA: DUF2384 domain-containing protein [Ottowia sp.]|uniref:antitoxin Xre-like helix-turn-helix domain-containing protein n=1 Tax=Ottowia sp. TaxID=1898956 RepID=UPI002C887E1D|nr:antitoxin Xre-like helix-turn-helix domain-containing protein [Ottowia sp.]HMN20717.1 DUF2384 domain-containing protein [Ottowia sp.]
MPVHTSSSPARRGAMREQGALHALRPLGPGQGGAFHLTPLERVDLVRRGVPARAVADMSAAMGLSREQFLRATGLARSTVERKIAARRSLSESESEKLVGLSRLIGQVEAMVRESGEAPADFDAARWFAMWMAEPVAALGGRCPQELLGTADGREALATLLLQMRSGVYA